MATVGTVASVGIVWAILIAGKLDTLALGERAAGTWESTSIGYGCHR
ncbi:heme ABC transporter [Cutibacterium acnes JCM 18916]|nr:heme ABC transporter [Cutibacterium acnes JCM 18916]GAE75466.1 heme ABC transporter [Cutibacterium acnes JCM 18918]